MQGDPRWSAIPTALAPVLAAQLDGLTDEVITAVATEVPLYRRPLEGDFGRGVRRGVGEALRQFTVLVATGGAGETGGLAIYAGLGRGEMVQGRPLESLLAAYRVGARIAWRRWALTAAGAGLGTDGLVALAELVFAHIDEMSAASADGYAAEQSARAGERDRSRATLAALLLSPQPDPASLAAAARPAGWNLPQTLCVVAAPAGVALASRLGADALGAGSDPVLAVLADPGAPARLPRLLAALAGTGAVIGPTRPLTGAAASRRRAEDVLRLRREGHLGGGEAPMLADDHLTALLLHADPAVARDLADAQLAGLAGLPAATADRLAETLHAWLTHAGERAAAARALQVHPQTVRYRMGQVRDLLGGQVDDPHRRFALLLALEVRRAGAG